MVALIHVLLVSRTTTEILLPLHHVATFHPVIFAKGPLAFTVQHPILMSLLLGVSLMSRNPKALISLAYRSIYLQLIYNISC